jgi:hypothetical protein
MQGKPLMIANDEHQKADWSGNWQAPLGGDSAIGLNCLCFSLLAAISVHQRFPLNFYG